MRTPGRPTRLSTAPNHSWPEADSAPPGRPSQSPSVIPATEARASSRTERAALRAVSRSTLPAEQARNRSAAADCWRQVNGWQNLGSQSPVSAGVRLLWEHAGDAPYHDRGAAPGRGLVHRAVLEVDVASQGHTIDE